MPPQVTVTRGLFDGPTVQSHFYNGDSMHQKMHVNSQMYERNSNMQRFAQVQSNSVLPSETPQVTVLRGLFDGIE